MEVDDPSFLSTLMTIPGLSELESLFEEVQPKELKIDDIYVPIKRRANVPEFPQFKIVFFLQ